MNQQLPELVEGMRRALRVDVQPELTSDHARSQLAGVLDILVKLERMIAWSPDVLNEQLETLRAGGDAFAQRAAEEGIELEAAAPLPPGRLKNQELEDQLRAAEARLNRHTDWLFAEGATLPVPARAALDAVLQRTQRELLLSERKLIPRANFGAMTAGASQTPAA